MEIMLYDHLDTARVTKQFEKTVAALQRGDFLSADVRKMHNTGYYRARLDDTNRLLFKFGKYEGKTYLFLLEVILNHDYAHSRFLNGAVVDEAKLQPLKNTGELTSEDVLTVPYVNPKNRHFHILDKILSFDESQDEVLRLRPPLIIIGSAGSGKTALTLEKMKMLNGEILYCTLSSFLVENSRNLYYSFGYENEKQEIDFLSFSEFLATLAIPAGKELTFRDFDQWIWRHKQAFKIKDTYKVFEEFKGVLTGSVIEKPYLSKEEYLSLGVRRSVFSQQEREQLYELFLRYLDFLKEGKFYDSNLVAYHHQALVKPRYDFVVVDEVQDITNVQLNLILRSLKMPAHFILCGDSNQVDHPNFFSWSNIKTMFHQQDLQGNLTRILATNYRNTPEVTKIANQLLLVKNMRFGSIDRESTYLVNATTANKGEVEFYEDQGAIKQDLDKKTARSARFAVLVMRNEDKAEARRFFRTPLLFSVQEAKGLEYENIILYNLISDNEREFLEICNGISPDDLNNELVYARAKDKSDKSLEVYKFYINSLYVAITRAVKNLYVVERNKKHRLLVLLGLRDFRQKVNIAEQTSSADDWQKEARRLELQGKQEQADAIRKNILQVVEVPWQVITPEKVEQLKLEALNPDHFNKKAKDLLFEYALFYSDLRVFPELLTQKYRRAEQWQKEGKDLMRRLLNNYYQDKPAAVQPDLKKYGVDFRNPYNLTPLMLAAMAGAQNIIQTLRTAGADPNLRDNLGRTAFQLSLHQSYIDQVYAKKNIGKIYPLLRTDSIKVKVFNQLLKINNHLMEYFMLNFMLATLRDFATVKIQRNIPGYDTADFLALLPNYPDHVMPAYRKQRPYLSSILSKNEIYRKDPYNRRLFIRIRQGYYLPNPVMEVQVGEGWANVYDLMGMEELAKNSDPNVRYFVKYVSDLRAKLSAKPSEETAVDIVPDEGPQTEK